MYQEHFGITSVSSIRKYSVSQICVHTSTFLHHNDCDEAGQLSTPFHWIVICMGNFMDDLLDLRYITKKYKISNTRPTLMCFGEEKKEKDILQLDFFAWPGYKCLGF